ncbi:hypothetical protein M7M4_17660 [Corynebacterium pseudogenitalium]
MVVSCLLGKGTLPVGARRWRPSLWITRPQRKASERSGGWESYGHSYPQSGTTSLACGCENGKARAGHKEAGADAGEVAAGTRRPGEG